MAGKQPRSAELLTTQVGAVIPWGEAARRVAEARFYWLATVHPDGRPHVRPVLGVWVDDTFHTTSNRAARKARNLARDPRCAITVRSDDLDVVIEGEAATVTGDAIVERVADAYRSKYGWPVTVRDGAFDAPYGAPTAGPPPYEVYEIVPTTVFGLGTDEVLGPRATRWQF